MNNRLKALFTTVALALVAAACAAPQQSNVNTATSSTTNGNAAAQATPPLSGMDHGNMNHGAMDHANMKSSPNAASQPYDLQFIDTMLAHHQGAVDMARPAIEKAQHNEIKEMARNIIRDQEREIAQMKQWREQWYAGKPASVNLEMPGMMDSMKGMDMNKLTAASGNEFDLMFLEQMTPHHQGAVVMARVALTKAEHPEIKRIAEQIISAQEREISQMNGWKEAWR